MTCTTNTTADWVISQSGFDDLAGAGITSAWVRAWLLSAGAVEVSVHLLESTTWVESKADWQVFFATEAELKDVAACFGQHASGAEIALENPTRLAMHYQMAGKQVLLLPIGDIVYQRKLWLAALNRGAVLLPLYISACDDLPIKLEPGMSASLSKPEQVLCLNKDGVILEEQVVNTLKETGICIRSVESCTAGSIASRLCRVPGSSAVMDRSWVTYSNKAKQEEVAVDAELIARFGAVSQEVVGALATGGGDMKHLCIATSGIAGPGGGTAEKPVGTVWIAVALAGQPTLSRCLHLSGARHEIQARAVIQSLRLVLTILEHKLLSSRFK